MAMQLLASSDARRTHVVVRAATELDHDSLCHLYLSSRRAAFMHDPPDAMSLDDFDRATDGEVVLVAEERGTVLGFASIWMPDSFLHNLFVHPEHLRRGVGGALLDACAPHFRSAATLKCRADNLNALAFYKSRGFSIESTGESSEGPYHLMKRAL